MIAVRMKAARNALRALDPESRALLDLSLRRGLDDDGVAGLHEQVEQERVGLHRPVGQDDLLRRHLLVLGDPRAQRQVAAAGAVGRGAAGVVRERALGGGLEGVDGDDVERRRAAGEGDRFVRGHRAVTITSASVARALPTDPLLSIARVR